MQRKVSRQITFETRIQVDNQDDLILAECANLFSRVERSLFAEMTQEHNINDLKTEFIKKFEITARHFNSCRKQLDGKIASKKELLKEQIKNLKEN